MSLIYISQQHLTNKFTVVKTYYHNKQNTNDQAFPKASVNSLSSLLNNQHELDQKLQNDTDFDANGGEPNLIEFLAVSGNSDSTSGVQSVFVTKDSQYFVLWDALTDKQFQSAAKEDIFTFFVEALDSIDNITIQSANVNTNTKLASLWSWYKLLSDNEKELILQDTHIAKLLQDIAVKYYKQDIKLIETDIKYKNIQNIAYYFSSNSDTTSEYQPSKSISKTVSLGSSENGTYTLNFVISFIYSFFSE